MTVGARIQLRRDTAANWTSANPILALGEPGYEKDTGKEKRGDGTTAWNSLPYFTPGIGTFERLRTFNVRDYGVVDDPTGATDQSTAIEACRAAAAASGIGGVIVFPPGTYGGKLVLTGNYRYHVAGYGATLFVPDSSVGIDVTTSNGGSALGSLVEGLHVKGSASKNATGVRVSDSDRVRFRDMSCERLAIGVQLRTTTGPNGCEANTLRDIEINNCTTGVDFAPNTGTGGSGHFDETFLQNININKCSTGVNLAQGSILYRAEFDQVTCWVDTNGCAVYADTDMTRVKGFFAGEMYSGATGAVGLKVGPNSSNFDAADLLLHFQPSLNPAVDTSVMANGQMAMWRDGVSSRGVSKSTASGNVLGPHTKSALDTFPRAGFSIGSASNAPMPSGRDGIFFGSGSAQADVVLFRPGIAGVLQMGFTNVLKTGINSTSNRPTAATVGDGSQFYDSTLKRPIWTDGTNWNVASLAKAPVAKTTSYTVLVSDSIVIANGATVTITLPSATTSGIAGVVYTVKNINSASATVASAAGTIDGASTATLAQWAVGRYVSDGTNWYAV